METVERNKKIVVGLKEASHITGLSYSCVRRLCLCNEIKYVKSGNRYMVNIASLISYCNQGSTV